MAVDCRSGYSAGSGHVDRFAHGGVVEWAAEGTGGVKATCPAGPDFWSAGRSPGHYHDDFLGHVLSLRPAKLVQ